MRTGLFRQKTVEAFPLTKEPSLKDSTHFDPLTAKERLSYLKYQINVELSSLSRTTDLLDPGKLTLTAPAISPIVMQLENKIIELKAATILLDHLVQKLDNLATPSLKELQDLYSSLDTTTQTIIAEAADVLKQLSSRIWKTPDLDDFNFDEAIEALTRLKEADFIDLKEDILAELNGWPSLAHINVFIKRWQSIVAVKEGFDSKHASTQIILLLIQLKKHLSRYSYSYSYSDIVSSQSFERCCLAKEAKSLTDAAGEALADSRGSYSMEPTKEEVARGLAEYERTNRPFLRLYDETGAKAHLCLIRTPGAETTPSDTTVFAREIFEFCDGNETFSNFICANLGIEPFMMNTCENMNTLHMTAKYMPLFPTDQYSISWHKLVDNRGVYYQHRLTAHCFHVMTTKGQIGVLEESSVLTGDRKLIEINAVDYETMLAHHKRLAPLFTTGTLSEIRLLPPSTKGSPPKIMLSIIEHSITILTPEITAITCPSPGYGAVSDSSSDDELRKFKL